MSSDWSKPTLRQRRQRASTWRRHRSSWRLLLGCALAVVFALAYVKLQNAALPQHSILLQSQQNRKHKILFVHIGETGGEFVKAQLAVVCKTRKNRVLQEECQQRFQSSKVTTSLLSTQTVGYFHATTIFPKNGLRAATHYLFSIRHPLSRFLSWYAHQQHPQSCGDPREQPHSPSCKSNHWKEEEFFSKKCFATLDQLVQNIMPQQHALSIPQQQQQQQQQQQPHLDKCNQLLWDGISGRVDAIWHPGNLHWNYQYYWNETLVQHPRKSVLVVRQESLPQDLQELEQHLTTTTTASQQLNAQPLQLHLPDDSKHFVSGRVSAQLQTNQQRNNLCCSLFVEEWPIYTLLIQRAENLSPPQKIESLQHAWKECGSEKHPADIVAILQSAKTLQDWRQAFMGDVCRNFYADDDAISQSARDA